MFCVQFMISWNALLRISNVYSRLFVHCLGQVLKTFELSDFLFLFRTYDLLRILVMFKCAYFCVYRVVYKYVYAIIKPKNVRSIYEFVLCLIFTLFFLPFRCIICLSVSMQPILRYACQLKSLTINFGQVKLKSLPISSICIDDRSYHLSCMHSF